VFFKLIKVHLLVSEFSTTFFTSQLLCPLACIPVSFFNRIIHLVPTVGMQYLYSKSED